MSGTLNIALVDDHILLRNGLASLINDLGYDVLYECDNGKQLLDRMANRHPQPDLVLMDINMPVMDGFATTHWLNQNYPLVNVIALSMFDDENSIIRMIKNGARGYILKDSHPATLKMAIESVTAKGYYYSDLISGKLLHSLVNQQEGKASSQPSALKDRELEFLKLVCSELTYKEIAERMNLSPRTVDGYRDDLFQKLGVKSRVGLVIFALKSSLVRFS
jgi:two-component system, NarL family, invasion response regulator UvrY